MNETWHASGLAAWAGRGFLVVALLSPLGGCGLGAKVFGPSDIPTPGQQMAAGQSYPNLGTVPTKVPATSTNAQRQVVTQGLVADQRNAAYSQDQLQAQPTAGGTVPAAPAPPLAPQTTANGQSPAAGESTTAPATEEPAASPPPAASPTPPPSALQTTSLPPPPAMGSAPTAPAPAEPPPAPAPAPSESAVPTPAAPAEAPAAAAVPSAPAPAETAAVPAPSAVAPAETTTAAVPSAPAPSVPSAPVPSVPSTPPAPSTPPPAAAAPPPGAPAIIDQARLTQLLATAPAPSAAAPGTAAAASPSGSAAQDPAAVIFFPQGSAALNGRDLAVLRAVVQLQKREGGRLLIIGHASQGPAAPGTGEAENDQISMARAGAVAQALYNMGAPGDAVEIAAVGAQSPIFLETKPTGEAGNRRVEIFLTP